jgi:hypothetical protein
MSNKIKSHHTNTASNQSLHLHRAFTDRQMTKESTNGNEDLPTHSQVGPRSERDLKRLVALQATLKEALAICIEFKATVDSDSDTDLV